jgi:dinuclear metal center YbgI/SA1388 family protein
MEATIADIIKAMETIAPSWLAEEWDNVGLQIGQKNWPVRTIWVALDPTPQVVGDACRNGVDLLITHHPLIFQPLRSIQLERPEGSIIQTALQAQMAIFSAHTNFDNVNDGLNDALARRIGLEDLKVLRKSGQAETYKLVVYVPVGYEKGILGALFESNAGEIGSYTGCSFRSKGKGTFKPDTSSKPFSGKIGEISHVDEVRIETRVRNNDLSRIVEHIRRHHPYETMAYDIYPLFTAENQHGTGRIGVLDKKMDLLSFALSIKKKLDLNSIKVAGNHELEVKTAAVCTGSGSSLLNDFIASEAHVYISGDLGYHAARTIEAANLGLIDIGHFASEHLIVDVLTNRLKKFLSETGIDVTVEAYRLENDPFMIL